MSTENAQKVKLTISGVLQDLKDGKDRDAIGEKYGLSKADIKQLFQHEKLKGRKVKKEREPGFELIDDVDEGGSKATTSKAKAQTTEGGENENVAKSTVQKKSVVAKPVPVVEEKEEIQGDINEAEAEVVGLQDDKPAAIKEVPETDEEPPVTGKGLW